MDNRILEGIRKDIEAETPDVFENIMMQVNMAEGQEPAEAVEDTVEENTPGTVIAGAAETAGGSVAAKGNLWKKISFISGAIAAAAIVILCITLLGRGTPPEPEKQAVANTPVTETVATTEASTEKATEKVTEKTTEQPVPMKVAAKVYLDVNPSIEFSVDEENKVSKCTAINEDGKDLLGNLDLTGTDVTVASYAAVGAMYSKGYLTDETNSVLVSVTSDDRDKGIKLEKTIADDLNAQFEGSGANIAILGQYIEPDETVTKFAEENGISVGKAWIIKQLVAANSRMTEESLLKLSTQELILLWTERTHNAAQPAENSTYHGKVNSSGYITADDAINNAVAQSNLGGAQATNQYAEFECEDGMLIYEVTFISGGVEYDVDVNAVTGEIIKYETEAVEGYDDYEEADDDYDDAADYDEPDDYDDVADYDEPDYDDYDEPDEVYYTETAATQASYAAPEYDDDDEPDHADYDEPDYDEPDYDEPDDDDNDDDDDD